MPPHHFLLPKKLNIGIIGCGDRGKGLMYTLKELSGQFQIKAICDVLDFRLEAAKKVEPSVSVTKDYRKILDNKDIDAVIIAVPLYLHFQVAKGCFAGWQAYLPRKNNDL